MSLFPMEHRPTMLRNTYDLMKHLKVCNHDNKTVILKAGASWCRPCRRIMPVFHRLSAEWRTKKSPCVFLEFNINENPSLTRYFNIREVPCFICLLPKKSQVLKSQDLRHIGADEEQLTIWLQRVLSPPGNLPPGN